VDTCLFTGEELGPGTSEEHTIPEKLAGCIRSKRVSSDDFNNRCSQDFDKTLVNCYAPVLKRLAPLLAREHKLGVRWATGRDGLRLRVGREGTVELQKERVEEDAAGQITKITARDEQRVREIAAARGTRLVETSRQSVPLADDERKIWFTREADKAELSSRVELAALKSAMLSFDEKLADSPFPRFTRHSFVDGVREFVRAAIMDDDALDDRAYMQHVMGLQYDKVPEIERVRCEHGPPERSEFEHVLVASGNTADRRLDVVWWIAGIDAFGFRLSHDWRECDFTCLLVSGMLKGESCSEPIWVNHAHSICARTSNCAVSAGDAKALAQFQALLDRRLERICIAHQRATHLVEMQCDGHVARRLARRAKRMAVASRTLGANAVLVERLRGLYGYQLTDPIRRAKFEATVARLLPTGETDARPPGAAADLTRPATWVPLLPMYREALREVSAFVGPPGHLAEKNRAFRATPIESQPS
jgi:hypothetical protein